jgi:hypothetical protein
VGNVSQIGSIAVKIALLALIVSLGLTAYYYVNDRMENEKVLNNIRSIALAAYRIEVEEAADFLETYANTGDSSARDYARRDLEAAMLQAEICLQGLPDDPDSMYTKLRDTAALGDSKFQNIPQGAYNPTKIISAVQILREIASAFFGVNVDGGRDPLERLGESTVNSVIENCEQILQIIDW